MSCSAEMSMKQRFYLILFFYLPLIQFNVPFNIISLISRRANRMSSWDENGNTPEIPPDTPASRTWLVPHITRVGLEPLQAKGLYNLRTWNRSDRTVIHQNRFLLYETDHLIFWGGGGLGHFGWNRLFFSSARKPGYFFQPVDSQDMFFSDKVKVKWF